MLSILSSLVFLILSPGMKPPTILSTTKQIQNEMELISALGEIEIAQDIKRKEDSGVVALHPLDKQYNQLRADIRVLSDPKTLSLINDAVQTTHASTYPHDQYKLAVERVFVLEREGEAQRYDDFAQDPNRQLLWYDLLFSSTLAPLSLLSRFFSFFFCAGTVLG